MRWREWQRPNRHLVGLVGLTVVASLLIGFVVYRRAAANLIREAEQELLLRMKLRTSSLEGYLETIRSEVVLWSDHGPPRDAARQLRAAWRQLGPDPASVVGHLYVTDNALPEGDRHKYDRAPDRSLYTELHANLHPRVNRFLMILGYHDALLIDPEGNVLYTYFKEEDFATNLVSGPWRQTGLAEVFREARDSRHGDVAFVDFQYYEPSEGAPAAFVAGPIFEDDGELLGVLALQVSPERINEEMHYTDGMGETGETFIVGDDLLMRSDSRFSDTSAVLERTVDTELVRRALAGESSVDRSIDYRGVEVLSAYGPVDFEGARWAVIADIELEEVLRPARMLRRNIFLTGLFVILLLALAGAVAPGPLTRNQ